MTDVVWEGAEALREYLVPVTHLERHPKNPRRGVVAMIAESLRRWGQVRLILHDGRYVIAGNHTLLAAQSLGWSHVAAVLNTFASAAEAEAYLLADNRIPELGAYDEDARLALLEELDSSDAWAGTGYTPDDLDDLRAIHREAELQPDPPDPSEPGLPSPALHEVVLIMGLGQAEQFETDVRIVQKELSLENAGVTEVVSAAVALAAKRVNLG